MASVPLPSASATTEITTSVEEPAPAPAADAVENPERPRSRRGLSRWGILIFLCGIGFYFSPELVARTSLRQQVPRFLFPEWSGTIELGETTLGWFSAIQIRDLKLTDQSGQTLASVGSVRSTSTLWQLLTNRQNLGEYDFEQTVVHLTLEGDQLNWQTPLQELGGAKSGAASAPARFTLRFPELQVLLSSPDSSADSKLTGLNLKVSQGESHPGTVLIDGTFPTESGQTSPSLQAVISLASDSPATLIATANEFDLTRLEGLTQLLLTNGVVRGRVSGTVSMTLPFADMAEWTIESDLHGKGMTAAGWSMLAGDVMTLEDLVCRGKMKRSAELVECQNLRFQTDFAKLSAQGTCRWAEILQTASSAEQTLRALGEDFLLTASIDAAQAAQRLPNVFRLKSGVAIQSGQIQATIQTIQDPKGRALDGQARLADLAAVIDGQIHRWSAPIETQVLVRPSVDGLQCDRLSLQSDFCTIQGQGTPNAARFRVTADLDRLWQELARLVDWPGVSIAGTAKLDGTIQRAEAGTVTLHVDGQGDGLRFASQGASTWSEPHLTFTLDASGNGPVSAPWTTISAGSLILDSGDDQCEVRLVQAVDWTRSEPLIPLTVTVKGDWSRWQQRVRPVWHDPSLTLAGSGTIQAAMNYSAKLIELANAEVHSQPLQITLPGWHIQDSAFHATGQGAWNPIARRWTTLRTELKGDWGTLTWTDGQWEPATPTGNPAGQFTVDINTGKVSRWQAGDVQHHVLGQLAGTVNLHPQGEQLQGDIDLQLTNAVLAGLSADPQPRWVAMWREPMLQVNGQLRHHQPSTRWDLSSMQMKTSGFSMTANGHIDPRSDGTDLDLQGQVTYDWEQVMSQLDPSWAQRIRLTGRGDQPYSVKGLVHTTPAGSMSLADLSGQIQLGWDQAQVFGLPLSTNRLAARVSQGQGEVGPIDLNVAQGRVHLAPRFDLRQSPVLTLPVGRVVDQLQLTPELCQQMLKYALPVAADAAEMDGAFSLDVDENVWPLSNPQAGKARGSLSIHRARIVPGPLANRLVGTVEQIRALLERRTPNSTNPARFVIEMPEQTVGLAQMNGRVYHDRMTIRIDNTELVTGGSVGLDESLQLTFLLPIQEKWVRGTPALAKLAGQSLRIPVSGTLSQPQVDASIIAQLAQQAAGSAIEKTIDDTVKKQLDRFLPRRN